MLFLPAHAFAESEPLKGVALVIGQSAYKQLPTLANPERDARAFENLLAKLGFETTLVTDQTKKQIRRSVDGFIEDAEGADVALVYYSGHGIEAGGTNYLIPTDAGVTSLQAADENFLALQDLLDRLRRKARITILLLDACRSNPFPKDAVLKRTADAAGVPIQASGLGAAKGATIFATPDSAAPDSVGEVIGFAAEPGHAAEDGAAGANSPYAAALLRHFSANAGFDFGQVMTMVTEEVYLATGTRQRPWTNTSLRQVLSFGGAVAAASPDDALLDGERRKLLLTIAATPQEWRRTIETLAVQQSLPLDPLYGMLRELQVDTSAGAQDIDKQLRAGAESLKKLLAEKVVPLRKDADLIRLSGLADKAQAQGAIALAKTYRAKASARADELDRTLDQREAEVTADRIELAATYAAEAQTAVLAFDYQLAATRYATAYEQVKGRDPALAVRYQLGEADALANHGDMKGDNQALIQAVSTYGIVLQATSRERAPLDWAGVQISLGNALTRLGQRDTGIETLNKAVAAYQAALSERTRERVPLDWAAAQSNLGSVLTSLGERESGTESLVKAVAAYEAALSVQTPARMPLDWAVTQNNLGTALSRLGQRETGTKNLVKAVAAYEAALSEQTRERVPLNWAAIQNNLGNTLTSLGQRESGTESLVKAMAAYEAALSELTHERAPLDWAMTQNSLGNALVQLGLREKGTESFTKAIAAYRAALSERTRARIPLEWAATQNNLGNALANLGEREKGTENLLGAIAAYEAALTEKTRERVPLDWAAIQNNLGLTLVSLAQRQGGTDQLAKAIAAYEAALSERTQERVPFDWATTQKNLGVAKIHLGGLTRDKSILIDGRQALQRAWDGYKSLGFNQYDSYFGESLKSIDAVLAVFPPKP